MSLKKILLISIFYILIGSIIFESFDEKLFQFLYLNGFEPILKFILTGNNDKLLKHIILADRSFYNIYFGFGLSLLSFFIIYNFKKILFKSNYLISSFNLKFDNIKKKDLLIKIILATALSLFLELSIIRIQSSYLHFFK